MRPQTLGLVALICLASAPESATAVGTRPNIVLIIADDMGWGDIGYNGSEIRTPHLDGLAESGARLDRFYATPACSSTRASLMTGQSSVRTGVTAAILQTSDASLPLRLKILPEFLRDAGYRTALVGKWHLGHTRKEMLPLARGFDYAYGFLTGAVGHYDHVSAGRLDWHRNEATLREEGYATHLIADDAIRQIEGRDKDQPLFLYVAFSAPTCPTRPPRRPSRNTRASRTRIVESMPRWWTRWTRPSARSSPRSSERASGTIRWCGS